MTPHGTANRYSWHGCRCQPCRDAMRNLGRRAETAARQRAAEDPALIPHGSISGYGYRACRCDECTAAMRDYNRRYRAAGTEQKAAAK